MLVDACELAIQQVIRNSLNVNSLLSYLNHPQKNKASLNICLKQLYKTLNSDVQAKKLFAKRKGLEYVMRVKCDDDSIDSNVKKMANEVLGLYPDDLVKLFKPNYPKLLLKKLDDFQAVE
jgi:NADPH-dependent 7-cyano-7-deazaguanine reductase QueF